MGVVADRREGDKILKDRQRLMEGYEEVLDRVKELETEKAVLEEKLRNSEAQRRELQDKLSAAVVLVKSSSGPYATGGQAEIDSKSLQEMRELHSSIARLLTTSEK
jgi:uncharacterized protein (DUF3084 family)